MQGKTDFERLTNTHVFQVRETLKEALHKFRDLLVSPTLAPPLSADQLNGTSPTLAPPLSADSNQLNGTSTPPNVLVAPDTTAANAPLEESSGVLSLDSENSKNSGNG